MNINDVLLFFSSCIIFAIFLYWLIPFCKNKLFAYRHTHFKRRLVLDLLDRAVAQRVKFRIEVELGEFKGSFGEGFCTLTRNNQLSIELIGTFAAQQWVHNTCRIFFHIIQANKHIYFHFVGPCIDAPRKGDITRLIFDLPEQLESGQKRKSLRCTPPKDAILGLAIWPLENQPLPNHRDNVQTPFMIYRLGKGNSLMLYDISAGGMRLMALPANNDVYGRKLNTGARMLCLLMLKNPRPDKKPLAIWVSCRIVSCEFLESAKIWQTCVRFDMWAYMTEGKKEILWFPCDENDCIPALSPLILRWNMEIHKKV